MQVVFQSGDSQGAQLRDTVVARVLFVMRRLSFVVPKATVRFADVNGPRGGLDKRCQIELKTQDAGVMVVSSTAGNWLVALNAALARAKQALMRTKQRAKPQHTRLKQVLVEV